MRDVSVLVTCQLSTMDDEDYGHLIKTYLPMRCQSIRYMVTFAGLRKGKGTAEFRWNTILCRRETDARVSCIFSTAHGVEDIGDPPVILILCTDGDMPQLLEICRRLQCFGHQKHVTRLRWRNSSSKTSVREPYQVFRKEPVLQKLTFLSFSKSLINIYFLHCHKHTC